MVLGALFCVVMVLVVFVICDWVIVWLLGCEMVFGALFCVVIVLVVFVICDWGIVWFLGCEMVFGALFCVVIVLVVFVICDWGIVWFLGCDMVFRALFSVVVVLVVFVYWVCVGLYVSYNLLGTIALIVCCFVVKELYLLRLIGFWTPRSVIILFLLTEFDIKPIDFGAEVWDEYFFNVVLSKGVLSLSWCVIEVLLGSFFFTFFVSWYS